MALARAFFETPSAVAVDALAWASRMVDSRREDDTRAAFRVEVTKLWQNLHRIERRVGAHPEEIAGIGPAKIYKLVIV